MKADVLLILDCCYAGTACRERRNGSNRFELLASCSEDTPTPAPGPRSFTTALIKEIHALLSAPPHIVPTIAELNRRLNDRIKGLAPQVILTELKGAAQQRKIRLQPRTKTDASSTTADLESEHQKVFKYNLEVTSSTELQDSQDQWVEWLTKRIPQGVSTVKVQELGVTGGAQGEPPKSNEIQLPAQPTSSTSALISELSKVNYSTIHSTWTLKSTLVSGPSEYQVDSSPPQSTSPVPTPITEPSSSSRAKNSPPQPTSSTPNPILKSSESEDNFAPPQSITTPTTLISDSSKCEANCSPPQLTSPNSAPIAERMPEQSRQHKQIADARVCLRFVLGVVTGVLFLVLVIVLFFMVPAYKQQRSVSKYACDFSQGFGSSLGNQAAGFPSPMMCFIIPKQTDYNYLEIASHQLWGLFGINLPHQPDRSSSLSFRKAQCICITFDNTVHTFGVM